MSNTPRPFLDPAATPDDRAWRRLVHGEAAAIVLELAGTETPSARWLVALALERLGRVDEAEQTCDALLREHGDHDAAWLTRASLHARRGERGGALASLDRADALRPGTAVVAHLRRAMGGGDFSAPLLGEVTELFERYAPRFETHLVGELGYRGHLVVATAGLEAVTGDALDVLDLGCGSGLCAAALQSRVAWLAGVDLSPAMLELARRSVDWRRDYDTLFAADVAYALATSPPASHDLILAADVFGYLGDLDAVLVESHRALRPGGVLAFSVEAAGVGVERFAMTPSRRCAYRADWVLQRAAAAGLECVRHDTAPLRHEAREAVAGHVVTLRRAAP